MRNNVRMARGLAGIFSALLVVSIGAEGILDSYRTSIDFQLGTRSTRVVTDNAGDDLYTYTSDFSTTDELVAYHKDLAERVEEEATVLLRNENNALPLASDEKVTLLGMRMNYPQYGGQISSSPKASQNVSPYTAFEERGFQINPVLQSVYEELAGLNTLGRTGGFGAPLTDYQPGQFANSFGVGNTTSTLEIGECDPDAYATLTTTYSDSEIKNSYAEYNTAIVMLGRPTSEAADFFPGSAGQTNPDEFDAGTDILGLSKNEKKLLEYATNNFGKVIVLINSGNAMDVPELKSYDLDAVLWIGEPGNYGFYGVADVLNGTVSPSGHLPDTFATKASLSPAMQNFGVFTFANQSENFSDDRNGWYLAELENIYIGYYYYETRYFDSIVRPESNAAVGSAASSTNGTTWEYANEVVYPFGYGLSYTTFAEEITGLQCDFDDLSLTAQVKVTNTGARPGKHAVQLYASAPYSPGGLEKSAIQLIGYEKTDTLEPGASQEVTISVDLQYLASYDENYAHDGVTGAYVLDAGDYYFATGNGAHEAVDNVLTAMGHLTTGNAQLVKAVHLDAQKALTHSKNGTLIQNQLQDADLKNNGVDVTYLSRSDWSGTFPKPLTDVSITEEMTGFQNVLYTVASGESSDILWNQNYGIGFAALKPAAGESIDYDDPRLLQLIEQMNLSEVLLNIRVGQSGWGEMVSIDQPIAYAGGGPMGFSEQSLGEKADRDGLYAIREDDPNYGYYLNTLPTGVTIAATFSREIAYEVGTMLGNDSIWNGVVSTWSPGANQHRTPYNGRNHEYFSEDPMLTAYMANDWCAGGKAYGLILCPKHFAFNDQETNRSGVAAFVTEQRAREGELRGFQMCFEEGNALGTMTTFNRVGSTYGSAHVGMMKNILRGEWGFKGIAITDMVNGPVYMNVISALMAGTDTMDSGSDTNMSYPGWSDLTPEKVAGDAALAQAVQDAAHHVEYALLNSNFMNGYNETTHFVRAYPWYEKIALVSIAATGVLTLLCAALYIRARVSGGKKEEK